MKLHTTLLLLALPAALFALAAARPDEKPTPAGAGTYAIDNVHTAVFFKCKHLDTSWSFGRFDQVSGSFTLDTDKPENSKVDVTIDTSSVNTNDEKRDSHLKSPDFFDVKQFPTATFKSKSVKKQGAHNYAVTGDLSFHGTTQSVTLDMEHTGSSDTKMAGKRVGFFGTLVISRAAFGVKYGPDALGDEVTLTLSVEGLAQ
ncbi:MAG: YceI family protein [Planctomycetes bacterium]|nr:YceI family protein [Planctomycetota bacterium]